VEAVRKDPLPAADPGSERESDVRLERASDKVPAGTQEVSSPHARVPELVPAAWLDRLLAAVVELPLVAGDRAVVEAMVDAVASILPSCAVGVCFVPLGQTPIYVKRLPEGAAEGVAGIDPTRLFPELAHEHVTPLAGSTTGSTMHVASRDDELGRSAPAANLADRAAHALGRALEHASESSALAGAQSDVRVLEQQLIQTDKLATFGQIAASVVHELNNPLTSIVAYSDLLIRKALSRGPAQDQDDLERLRRIVESANRMLRFTRDLTSYARPSAGKTGPVVLHAIIDQAIAFCEHVLAEARVQVERSYGADVLTVHGASEQLVQVFVNLLTNASQAVTPDGGIVRIGTSLDGSGRRVLVVVEDNGTGIAAEHLPHVFAAFFTTKSHRHGTGLGLSIVKSIVERHDGGIRVETAAPHGTRFVLELPCGQRSG
jgi:two-component system NtrC family sensor kinase